MRHLEHRIRKEVDRPLRMYYMGSGSWKVKRNKSLDIARRMYDNINWNIYDDIVTKIEDGIITQQIKDRADVVLMEARQFVELEE